MAAQEIVELFCELVSVRLPIIEAQRYFDPRFDCYRVWLRFSEACMQDKQVIFHMTNIAY